MDKGKGKVTEKEDEVMEEDDEEEDDEEEEDEEEEGEDDEDEEMEVSGYHAHCFLFLDLSSGMYVLTRIYA
jgi:hypothetical protein